MKFVSKSSNLMLVLKPGLPGNHLTGQSPVTGIYVKFSNGMVDVKDDSIVEMMKRHPALNIDFVAVDEASKEEDPYAYYRSDSEPTHVTSEIKYGHVERSTTSAKPKGLPPELAKLIKEQAMSMAKEMVKEMLPDLVKSASTKKEEVKEEVKEETEAKIETKKDKKEKTSKEDSEAQAE